MKRFVPVSALAVALCLTLSFGFAPYEKHGADAEEMTIHISSDAGEAHFEAHFESETGFSISTNDGVTPATFTVKAERFTGIISAKQGASISVEASRGGLKASRTNSGAIRVTRSGHDFTVSGIKAENEK